jgi:RNA exonuclease 4
MIRDTSSYKPFRVHNRGRRPALKVLAASILGLEVQKESHSSIEDARVAMMLYKHVREEWEKLYSKINERN